MNDRLDLHALADDELTPEQREQVLSQIASDPKAAAEYQSVMAMKNVLRDQLKQPDCEVLWKQCRGRLDEMDKAKRVENFVGKYAWGLCGLFFIFIAFAGVFNRRSTGVVPSTEVASVMAGMSPISVSKNQNQSDLEPRLKEIVGNAFLNRPSQMSISAVAESAVPGHRTQFVQLQDEFGRVGVMALYDVREVTGMIAYEGDPHFGCAKVNGINTLFWNREDGVICMVVGQRSYDELFQIVQSMCPHKH